jgi:hypothetical protein
MSLKKAAQGLLLAIFASSTIACGAIEVPMTLAFDDEVDNGISVEIPAIATTLETALTGYLSTTMVVNIDVWAWIKQQGVLTTIEITDLLFAGEEFLILGQPSEEVCVVLNEADPGGGTAFIDIFAGKIAFMMTLSTNMLIGNEALSGAIPDGFPFATEMAADTDFNLVSMVLMLLGVEGQGMTLGQHIEDDVLIPILGMELPAHITADMTLTTVNQPPTNELIEGCLAFLAE